MVSARPASATSRLEPRHRLTLAVILVAAFALRVAYVLSQRRDVLFDFPAMDEERYVQMARDLAAGRRAEAIPWFQPPGLVYALASVFSVAGEGLLAPRLVQALVSTGACGLAFVIARRFFGTGIALATAALCAVHGVFVFESYELLPPTWVMAADLLAIWTLLRAGDEKTPNRAFGAGVALGVSAVFAPIVLPFALVAAVWLRRWPMILAFSAGLSLAVAPVTIGNWKRGHELVLISTNGGINFYLGNNAEYDSTLALRPGRHWEELLEEPNKAGAKTAAERSAYFAKKGLSFYATQPGRALGLYLHKLFLYFDGVELPRDTDVYAERRSSPVLRVLVARGPPAFPDGVLLPMALVGIGLSWRERRKELWVLLGFLALQAAGVAAFFVTSRYRMPALPLYAMFAAVGACGAFRALTKSGDSLARRAAPISAVLVLAVVLGLPVREGKASYAAERDFYRGLAEMRQRHDAAASVAPFRRSTEIDPTDARVWFELGNALASLRRQDEAIDAWKHAAALDRSDRRALGLAVSAMVAKGDLDGAIAALQEDVDAGGRPAASYAPSHLELAMLRARRGDYARAIDALQSAAREDPVHFRTSVVGFTRALLALPGLVDAGFWIEVGDAVRDLQPELARDAWKRARASNPSAAQLETLAARLGP